MIKMMAFCALALGLAGTAFTGPAGLNLLSDTGAWSADTAATDSGLDTGTEAAMDTGADTSEPDAGDGDSGLVDDTGTPEEDTAANDEAPTYSAAELANDKGGCSVAGTPSGAWTLSLALFGLLTTRRRRRDR